jgi:hypothetical protein
MAMAMLNTLPAEWRNQQGSALSKNAFLNNAKIAAKLAGAILSTTMVRMNFEQCQYESAYDIGMVCSAWAAFRLF